MHETTTDHQEPRSERDARSLAASYHRLFWPATPRSAPVIEGACAAWEDDGGAVLRSIDEDARVASRTRRLHASSSAPHPLVAFLLAVTDLGGIVTSRIQGS